MYKSAAQRYQIVNGKETIQIRVNSPLQLFDSRDPAPFRDRDLDDDFTDYLISCADEVPNKAPLLIEIIISKSQPDIRSEAIVEAIQNYFQYQIELKKSQFAKMFRMARLFLFVGMFVLALCLGLSQLTKHIPNEIFSTTFREGIVIFGWVSMWKPLELLLFDWYPIYDRIQLLKRILAAEIQVHVEVPGSSN